jgi:WD40 repeat protein
LKSPILFLCVLTSLVPALARAQMPGPTDIFLVRFADLDSATVPIIQVTQRPGYDNQPCFTLDNRALLYASIRQDAQADIFRMDLATRKEEQLTRTPESEFSPTPLPDGSGFSVVRVESDSTQRLWKFPYGKGKPSVILEKLRGVGYHAWMDANRLALFMLGDPNFLILANATSGDTTTVAYDIGRSLSVVPGHKTVSFLQNASKHERWITEVDPDSKAQQPIAPAPDGSEDFAWTPDGRLLMAQGLILAEWNPGQKQWETLAVFGGRLPGRISRLAVSPDGKWLAMVADEKTTP